MHEIRRIGIIGTGVMGTGIARVLALSGYTVQIVKWTEGTAEAARAKFELAVMKDVERGKLTSLQASWLQQRLVWSEGRRHGLERCDLVIEAIVEDEEEKVKCFATICPDLKQSAILASTTSSLGIETLAKATGRPQTFLGLHFFNPPTAMKLVELVVTDALDPQCLLWMRSFLAEIGKEAVEVRDAPGFVVNRLLVAQFMEAIRMAFGGDRVADIASIDACMRLGANHPMGPFELMDFIGLDVVMEMAENLLEGLRQPQFLPATVLETLVVNGWYGRKSGLGFYDYTDRKKPVPNPALETLASGS